MPTQKSLKNQINIIKKTMFWIMLLSLLTACVVSLPEDESTAVDTIEKSLVLSPKELVEQALSVSLTFRGSGLLYGSGSIDSCVWSNDSMIVVSRYCSKEEFFAVNIYIYLVNFGVIEFFTETTGKPSQITREQYIDDIWYVSYSPLEDLVDIEAITQSFDSFAQFFAKTEQSHKNYCIVTKQFNNCYGNLISEKQSWFDVSQSFWQHPSEDWYALIKRIRVYIQDI